jgi:phage tail-like protein
VALAASPGGQLALLAWESGADAAILLYTASGFVEYGRLTGLRVPYALAWNGEDELAVIASQGKAPAPQAYVYAVAGAAVSGRPLYPEGRIHPLLRPWNGGFCNALGPQPRHLQVDVGAGSGGPPSAVRPLHALSGGHYAREGQVLVGPIDGGVAGCVWHRFYAEAALADNTAIDLQLFANDLADDPALPPAADGLVLPASAGGPGAEDPGWALHRILPHRREDTPAGTPVAAWLPAASEIPLAPAMLACATQVDKAGLFTALIQQPGRVVRRVAGRYLWVLLRLSGDSQCSPELAALRFYARRLSWRDRYLPAFYSERLSGSDAQAAGPATAQDFMERLLHSHEGALTEIEGRIADSWQLTDPTTAPDAALPWLGAWIGLSATRGEATARQRQRLRAAPYTAPLAGTLGGLLAALELTTGGQMVTGGGLDPGRRIPGPGELAIARDGDIAVRGLMLALGSEGECTFLTGGAVTKGDIVVVEGFRLRRTFATILGADLDAADDPLTLGLSSTGNSFLGDTLILGDEARDELLALFAPEIDTARGDAAAVARFYARLAWRVMVLVRGVTDTSEFQRLADVVAAEVPAHVEPQVLHAQSPLIVGAASLVGIDTYLGAGKPVQPVRLGESWVGTGDVVAGAGGLDARADGPVPTVPTARADGPARVWTGSAFTLSALASRAGTGGQINRYIWMWEKES